MIGTRPLTDRLLRLVQQGGILSRSLLTVPNVTIHPSWVSVPTLYYKRQCTENVKTITKYSQ